MRRILGYVLALFVACSPVALLVNWGDVWTAIRSFVPLGVIMGGVYYPDEPMIPRYTTRPFTDCYGCGCDNPPYSVIGSVDSLDVMQCRICGAYDITEGD